MIASISWPQSALNFFLNRTTPPMGRTACREPQCLYKGALYLTSVPVQGCSLPFYLLSTVRLTGKHIIQMSLFRSKIWKKVLLTAVGDRHCQNVLRDVCSSPAVCLLSLQNLIMGLRKCPLLLYKLRHAFMINHNTTRDSTDNVISGIKELEQTRK